MAQSAGGGHTHSTVDIPFDLNKIFHLTYEFQPLKEVLEHIFGELKNHKGEFASINDKISCLDK